MSVVDRYVVKETASHAAAGFLVVLVVFLVTRLGSLLGDAAVGALPGSVVAVLLALRTIMALPSLLPAVLYVGVLLALSRLSRDHELTALAACGVAPSRVHRTIIVFSACVTIVTAFLSFTGRPWAAARFNHVRDHAIAASGLEHVTPGYFYQVDPDSHEVLFAESRSASAPEYLENVFVHKRTAEGITVFYATRAVESRDTAAGFRFLTLLQGVQYDLDRDGGEQNITRYEALTLRAALPPIEPDLKAEKTVSAWALVGAEDPEARAELQWRSAMPVSALVLALLALPLGRTDLRRGGSPKLFVALLLYVVYRTLLSTGKSWVADGVLPPFPGLWLIHAAALVIALLLLRPSFSPLKPASPRALDPSMPA